MPRCVGPAGLAGGVTAGARDRVISSICSWQLISRRQLTPAGTTSRDIQAAGSYRPAKKTATKVCVFKRDQILWQTTY